MIIDTHCETKASVHVLQHPEAKPIKHVVLIYHLHELISRDATRKTIQIHIAVNAGGDRGANEKAILIITISYHQSVQCLWWTNM